MKKLTLLLSLCSLFVCTRVGAQLITTICGNGTPGMGGDGGPATAAALHNPRGLAVDASGKIYITDFYNQRIRAISTSGIITTIAGTSATGYFGDGGPATAAKFLNPYGLAVDASGNLLIADFGNHVIRRINSSGIISTIAGVGAPGFGGDGGPATSAHLYRPAGVATNSTGNIYISDTWYSLIRKVSAGGTITRYGGDGVMPTAGYAGDGGPATAAGAKLNTPFSVQLDVTGNLFIADAFNHVIRKINTTTGIITTVAGNGTPGYSGDGGPATSAKLDGPHDIAFDAAGNMYISDRANDVIRMVNTSGIISTVAGTGVAGFSGDNGPANMAKLNAPYAIEVDNAGNLLIADLDNNRIRKVGGVSITVSPNDTICTGTLITFTAHTLGNAGGLHYLWKKNGIVVGGDSIVYNTASYTTGDLITCTLTGTGDVSNTIALTLTSLPVVMPVTGANEVCVGSTITLSTTSTGGTWSSGSTAATVTSGGVVTGVAAAPVIISYTVTNSCGGTSATKSVTVNPFPAPTLSGPASVCVGGTAAFIGTPGGGSWAASNSNASVSGGIVTGVAAGGVDISYTTSNGCGSTTATQNVVVDPLPVPPTLSGPATVCIGATITFAGTPGGGIWTASNANATVSGGIVTGVSAGTVSISYTTSNTCGSAATSQPVTVIDCSAGVHNFSGNVGSFAIYPNPSTGSFTLTMPQGDAYVVTITDIYGREVARRETNKNTLEERFDLGGYNNGLYFVTVAGDGASYTAKVSVLK